MAKDDDAREHHEEGGTFMLDLPQSSIEQLPDHIIRIVEELPFVVGGEEANELNLIQEGRCVACECDLGEDTVVVVNGEGIQALVCGGACHDDMMIYGYLTEQVKDLVDRVQMRRNVTEGHD